MSRHLFLQLFEHGRDIGISHFLHGQAPWPVLVLFAVITQLGDVWFLFLLGGSLYIAGEYVPRWGIERRQGLFVFGLVLSYIGLIGGFKIWG